MAACVNGIFDDDTKDKVQKCELLVVGAGGIGCELLKTLVLTGFKNIHVVDLDTIDLSNLNRQFLFHKKHIGRPKVEVARESVLEYSPDVKITAYHDSITKPKYNVDFYRQFTAVANALDNVGARSHVNRMCMAADVPLIESGSRGYLGQTTVHKKRVSECFECLPKRVEKTYPSCTIRNTPTEPVHCVVWAKHLFNQLFGESDFDDDVSPDLSNEEAGTTTTTADDAETTRQSTRDWAISTNYDPHKLFHKLFHEDILYLISMKHLWENREAPQALKFEELPDAAPSCSKNKEVEIRDWLDLSIKEYGNMFIKSLTELHQKIKDGGPGTILVWDKDDSTCLDFVTACSNLRSYCFHIKRENRFKVKAIAGNIVPAIATTNAIVSGLMVLNLINALKGDFAKCRSSWINESYQGTCKVVSAGQLEKPNEKCMVCSTSLREVTVRLNISSFMLKTLREKILKEQLRMVQPDAIIHDGSGKILISSDPDDMSDDQYEKCLHDFIADEEECRLMCEDFLQNFKVLVIIINDKSITGQEFVISQMDEALKEEKMDVQTEDANNVEQKQVSGGSSPHDDDDELEEIVENEIVEVEEKNGAEPPPKKLKTDI